MSKVLQAGLLNQSSAQVVDGSLRFAKEPEHRLTRAMTDSEVRDFLTQNIHYIIKLQSWYRGNKARRRILFLRSKQIGLKKYLNRVEV